MGWMMLLTSSQIIFQTHDCTEYKIWFLVFVCLNGCIESWSGSFRTISLISITPARTLHAEVKGKKWSKSKEAHSRESCLYGNHCSTSNLTAVPSVHWNVHWERGQYIRMCNSWFIGLIFFFIYLFVWLFVCLLVCLMCINAFVILSPQSQALINPMNYNKPFV